MEPHNDRSAEVTVPIEIEWSNERVSHLVAAEISRTIMPEIKEKLIARIEDDLDDQINQMLAGYFDREVQLTDKWGHKIGDPKSIRDRIMKDTSEWLNEKVDNYGRASSGSYSRSESRIKYLFRKALEGDNNVFGGNGLDKMVLQAIRDNIGDVQEMVNEQVREAFKQQLKKA